MEISLQQIETQVAKLNNRVENKPISIKSLYDEIQNLKPKEFLYCIMDISADKVNFDFNKYIFRNLNNFVITKIKFNKFYAGKYFTGFKITSNKEEISISRAQAENSEVINLNLKREDNPIISPFGHDISGELYIYGYFENNTNNMKYIPYTINGDSI